MKNVKNEKGQSLIEFILTFAFSIGVVFLFFTLARNFTTGYLVHYVTYMTGRTFLTYDLPANNVVTSVDSARTRAQEVFRRYNMNRFGVNESGLRFLLPNGGGTNNSVFVGATTQFQSKISNFNAVGGSSEAVFLSEALLGKEPTRKECLDMICEAMGIGECDSNFDITVFDNGC
jgi:hypothetical protein